MTYHIDIQQACTEKLPFTDDALIHWATCTLETHCKSAELTLRFVDPDEIVYLNHHFRNQNKPTNVLAFPSVLPEDIRQTYPLLGDVIICPSILLHESMALRKTLQAHWAHIVIHGILHLLGYDHVNDEDASIMQTLETDVMTKLGFDNPYQESIEDSEIE